MSTNVVRPGTTSGSGRPSRFLGVAAAGLAVVIAIGVTFAVNQGNEAPVGRPSPGHPMVSDAHRAKAEFLAERQAERVLEISSQRYDEHAEPAQEISSQRYEEYVEMLTQRAAQAQQAMWDQRYDDLSQRFENQFNGGTERRPIGGR